MSTAKYHEFEARPSVEWPEPPAGVEGATPVVAFRVEGEVRGAGSKVAGVATKWNPEKRQREVVLRANGMPQTFTKDSSGAAGAAWREDVRYAGRMAMGDRAPIEKPTPLAVRFSFDRPRPAGHHGTGRNAGVLRPGAPRSPVTRPDVLKVARAVEDALTGVCWDDDSQIVVEQIEKRYGGSQGGVIVAVWALPESMADDAAPSLGIE